MCAGARGWYRGECAGSCGFATGAAFRFVLPQENGLPHQCAHWFAMTCRNMRRVSIGNHAFPGQIRSAFHIRPKDCFSFCAAAGERIATPVCALVRNDMQKVGRCARVQGRNDMLKTGRCQRLQERITGANLQLFRISLKCYVLFCAAAGEADCHTSVRTGSQ